MLGEPQDRLASHAVAQYAGLLHALMVHELQNILSHGRVGVHVVVCTFPVISCVQHPHVVGFSVTLAQGLPIV